MLTFGQTGFGLWISTRDIARAAATEALQQHQPTPESDGADINAEHEHSEALKRKRHGP